MKPKFFWIYGVNACEAYTKSEARAQFKKMLNIKRLPVGSTVVKSGPIEREQK